MGSSTCRQPVDMATHEGAVVRGVTGLVGRVGGGEGDKGSEEDGEAHVGCAW